MNFRFFSVDFRYQRSVVALSRRSYKLVGYGTSYNRIIIIIIIIYYATLLPRRGPHIASHSVCLSLRLSVRPVIVAIGNVFSSTASVTDVLFGTH